jgi:hypothetical protein
MMAKKPIERPQTAGEVSALLKDWLGERGRSLGGGHIEPRESTHDSGVGSGVFTRFALGIPQPSSGKSPGSGSGRTISVSDRDTKKLDDKGSGPDEDIGLAPLDEEDVLGARRPQAKKQSPTGSDKKSASTSDLATSSDVVSIKPKTTSSSAKGRSLLEEELIDPDIEQIKKKMAQRAQFNPLQPPNYVPPSSGTNWVLWVSLGVGALVVIAVALVAILR